MEFNAVSTQPPSQSSAIQTEYKVRKQSKNYSAYKTDQNDLLSSMKTVILSHDRCDKCFRVSTHFYPLSLIEVTTDELSSRRFGRSLQVRAKVFLCELCHLYLSEKKVTWKNAWPCVLYSFIVRSEKCDFFHDGCNFLEKLPFELAASWFHEIPLEVFTKQDAFVFNDVTQGLSIFAKLINSYTARDFVTAMNCFPFPSVRCFCGSNEYIEEVHFLGFQHLLNFIDSMFVSFNANFMSHLRCIREDFFKVCDKGVVYQVRPSVCVNESGLCLAVCALHARGSKLRMIHMARNPILANLNHPKSDRLAPIASVLRDATPSKKGEFSHTWTMSKPLVGFSGAGSIVLHTKRSLAAKSQFLLPVSESIFVNNRKDMKKHLENIRKENFVPPSVICKIFEKRFDQRHIDDCLKSAQSVPMSTIIKCKEFFETVNTVDMSRKQLCSGALCLVPANASMAKPTVVSKTLCKQNYYSALLYLLFKSFYQLSETIVTAEASNFVTSLRNLLDNKDGSNFSGLKLFQKEIPTPKSVISGLEKLVISIPTIEIFNDQVENLRIASDTVALFLIFNNQRLRDLPVVLETTTNTYNLVFTEREPLKNHGNILLAFCGQDSHWKVCLSSGEVQMRVGQQIPIPNRCRIAMYVKKHYSQNQTVSIAGAQNEVFCVKHELPLCSDFMKTRFKCCVTKCPCKSNWRCPQENCFFALCRKHFKNFKLIEHSEGSFLGNAAEDSEEIDEDCISEAETLDEEQERINDSDTSDTEFVGPSASFVDGAFLDTDAGGVSTVVEVHRESEDLKAVPVQLLLNYISSVLVRKKTTFTPSKKLLRFFQTFAAKQPQASLSLLQPEGLLFPSCFFHQDDDGTYSGALPFFLYADKSYCKKLKFHSLVEHLQLRLKDLTLPTSGNCQYIQFCTDTIVNLNLSHHHTNDFVKRGIQSIEIDDKPLEIHNNGVTYVASDTINRVPEIATSMRKKKVKLFVTMTLNAKDHPGVAPISESIANAFEGRSQEEKDAAEQTYMGVIIRSWSRTVKHFLNLVLHSTEKILGKVTEVWCRAEFQTTAGNPQHYHFLTWNDEEVEELLNKVQCSEKHLMSAFQQLFNSDLRLIDSEKQLMEHFAKSVRLHSHNCWQANNRCLKRIDQEGNKVCRFPPNPMSHMNWVLDINTKYPDDALQTLQEIEMAELLPGTRDAMIVKDPLKCRKMMYAASSGEHMLPTNALLFMILLSSVTVLCIVDGRMAASYLSKYLGKDEEHGSATLTPGSDGKSLRLRSEGITNKGLTSVKFWDKEDQKSQRKQENISGKLLSVTESFFWVTGEPYIITNIVYVKLQNTPPENRVVKFKPKKNRGINPTLQSVCNFRDLCEDLEEFKKPNRFQKLMVQDMMDAGEELDKMTSFSLRPPELLIVERVENFFEWFVIEKRAKLNQVVALFSFGKVTPWITIDGKFVRLRRNCLPDFLEFLYETVFADDLRPAVDYNIRILLDNSVQGQFLSSVHFKRADVVFASVHPAKQIDFLVSFLLRFGSFKTEAELYTFHPLVNCFVAAGIIDFKRNYERSDVLQLLKEYVLNELRFLPGGSLTFSAKLRAAKLAFSNLLCVENVVELQTPLVLISDIVEREKDCIENFVVETQERLFENLARLQLLNLPSNLSRDLGTHLWTPEQSVNPVQSDSSQQEQQFVIRKLMVAILRRLESHTTDTSFFEENYIVLGIFQLCNNLLIKVVFLYKSFQLLPEQEKALCVVWS